MHSFSFNLVSLSRLTDSAHLLVLFHDFWCFIKDQLSRRMIGSPRKCHGLYYLCDTSPPSKPAPSTSSVFNSTSTSSVSYLWHARLGLQNLRNKQARFSCSGHQARKWLYCVYSTDIIPTRFTRRTPRRRVQGIVTIARV